MTSATASMDLELKKAFTEMQINKIETSKKLRVLDLQIDALKKSKQRLEITEHEVSNLNPDVRVYASIGRMFVLSEVPVMSAELISKQAKVDNMIVQFDNNKGYLLKNLKNQEDNLRELVQQKRDADGTK